MPSPRPPVPTTHVGKLLREWRAARRISQLDLALRADVSGRHVNRIETGKSQPSVELMLRLADALDVPLRERNTLLVAAGYAPRYAETDLKSPELALVRQAVEYILEHQEPYPAFITDVYWDVLMTNRALTRLFGWLRDHAESNSNILRQIFDPRDMRQVIHNWDEVAEDVIKLLHDQVPRRHRTRRRGRCSTRSSPIPAYPIAGAPAICERRPCRCSPANFGKATRYCVSFRRSRRSRRRAT